MKKQFLALTLSAALLCGTAAAGWIASANLRPDINVVIDGTGRTFYNVNGQEVHPISYQNTTYLPVRAIGELMGKNVNWDASTLTVSIGGTRVTGTTSGTLDNSTKAQNITLTVRPEYTVVIDGTTRTFYDAKGQKVDPIEYNGSIYLPIRAIGELMGKTVGWNESTQTVTLTGGSTVTDFDTSNPTTTPTTPSQPQTISIEQAKQIALQHAGVSVDSVQFLKTRSDYEDGALVYEIEFVRKNGNIWQEYDYEIAAVGGKIVSYDSDVETSYSYSDSSSTINTAVSLEQAKTIALNHAGVSQSSVTFTKAQQDYDDGRRVYDIDFVYETSTQYTEYDYEINAQTGAIISYDSERKGKVNTSTTAISAEQAKQIALSRVPGATTSNLIKFEQDYDDGRLEYEGEIYYQGFEYEFTIDAQSGSIIDWDVDR